MATATFTFDEAAHVYRDGTGMVVPSVTQCLKACGLVSFDGINPQVLERKRQLGTLVHKVTELYDNGEPLDEFEIPEQVWEYVTGYVNFREDCGFAPSLVEVRMLGEVNGMAYGMQPDRTGEICGLMHVIELKCGAAEHPAWGVQLAAYDMGLYGPKSKLSRAAVQLGPQFPRGYKIHAYEDRTDYQTWQCSLALTIWQKNKGLFNNEPVSERLEAV